MKSKIWGLLAAALLVSPLAAHAAPITSSGGSGGLASLVAVGAQNIYIDNIQTPVGNLSGGGGGGGGSGGFGGGGGLASLVAIGAQNIYINNIQSPVAALTGNTPIGPVGPGAPGGGQGGPGPIAVPEPGTLALLGLGLVGIGLRRRIRAS